MTGVIINVLLPSRNASVDEKTKVIQQRKLLVKEQRESYALRMEKLYKLSLASHVSQFQTHPCVKWEYFLQLKDDKFWLPHDIDFRGRAYAIPPHISHLC